ncbi:glycosyl hydrolase family 95 catalytic domain-containing protein [Pedobacter frigoris]|uniref:glycosyl hydrolase family 95 catalytic domain-containing protein n=1 Tax=Pedobacter frigoris TaxID=2571272 RepID=UPI00292DE9FF|nr:hypothetical protein [Pedobacter frigoris]
MKYSSTFLLLLLFAGNVNAQVKKSTVDWPSFMGRQTLKWDSISTDYYTGIILGNGLLGTNIYKENDHAVRFDIGRSDVTDQREHSSELMTEPLISRARLPIGKLLLKTSGTITGAKMELSIYNGKASGVVYTTKGSIEFEAYVHANKNIIYISAKGNKQELVLGWEFVPEKSRTPRMAQNNAGNPSEYIENPPFKVSKEQGFSVCSQPLLNNGGYATVWSIKKALRTEVMVSVGYDAKGNQDEVKEATNALKSFNTAKLSAEFAAHANWWHQFYQQSFVSLPDQRMESFYWIQLYKLASATRTGKPMIDLMGPWFTSKTPWPAVWWNLNTQLTYSPVFTSNHLELAKPLFQALNQNTPNLINNVPAEWRKDAAAIGRISGYDLVAPVAEAMQENGQFELGNLTWTLFYYHQYYTYSGDSQELKAFIYPLLKRSVNHLIYHLKKDDKGIYHLPVSFSPEYKSAADANYALSSLNWGLQTLIQLDADENLNDPDKSKWEEILQNIVPYPVDDTGLMIGKDVSLTSSHRHYSHMLMVYPYRVLNWDQSENRELIEKSMNHWLSLKGALQGYTFTGAAAINAMMGRGDQSYDLLNQLFDKYIQPNTLYRESGSVIETPLAAATSIQEMLLQSWGGKIRVFPAIPSKWQDVSFDKLRAEGAFLVSAKRIQGKTVFIKIFSTKGGKCKIETDMQVSRVSSDKTDSPALMMSEVEGKTNVVINTVAGETMWLSGTETSLDGIGPVKPTLFEQWSWGLNKKR